LLSFGASAWRLAARERFIGWQEDQLQRTLVLVVNNPRFLILPWFQGLPNTYVVAPEIHTRTHRASTVFASSDPLSAALPTSRVMPA
jgi:hypothetical protein